MRGYHRYSLPSSDVGTAKEYRNSLVLWALRMLVRLGGYRRVDRLMDEQELLEAVGVEIGDETPPAKELKTLLSTRLREAEGHAHLRLGTLGQNVRILADILRLGEVDQQILVFVALLHSVPWLESAGETLGPLDDSSTFHVLANVLELPLAEIRDTFAPEGTLATSRILRLEREGGDLKNRFAIDKSFAAALSVPQADAAALLKPFFRTAPAPTLAHRDFGYAENIWTLVEGYLRNSADEHPAGINILIYGASGAGKTEFVRTMAAELGMSLSEVVTKDSDGEMLNSGQRYNAYLVAQRVLANSTTHLILFDEVEDVFPRKLFGMFESGNALSKAGLNEVLEQNRVPAFWLSNHAEQIDPAYVRRFDLVIEIPAPTRSVRKNLLARYMQDIPVTPAWIERIAEQDNLMPALIERTAKVVRSLKPRDAREAESRFEQVLSGNLEARGERLCAVCRAADALPYRLDCLNPSVDLGVLCNGLKRRGQGRLCLYGPPGTGKTAFGHHLAEVLDRPLLQKRASDLLSMWVGGNEKNIARMFREAEREDAVLLLDEADSFLQDRGGAQRSWEVTQVNELLTQMEAFEGVFIASTNLMDNLDTAALSRFDFKVRFDYLKPDQREALFADLLTAGGNPCIAFPETLGKRLRELDTLTPGDFAVAVRQARFAESTLTAEQILAVLEAECVAKQQGRKPFLGFTGRA